ncbi:uncharacterized protein LOC124169038 isoform X1 [Ischnura elegans]|uniref:uncharacterized protein LOC124169038 isoform X1 n=1 Tax=Ischnura elegans TaxID=197161 RepID=UPI001ED897D5|nr:uncharacterized protein LOC124169038 isoform X1 [Ischnura elegans]
MVNGWLAEYLTELKLKTTQIEFLDSLTQKMHLLQFVNYFASIIYAAFLKGMVVGSPGGYDHLFGSRHEEDYEGGSDVFNEAMKCAQRVEPVKTASTSKIKVEEELVGKCLQGDLPYIFKQSTEKSSTSAPTKNVLSYKKPLLKRIAYATHGTWMEQSYDKQFLLPSTHVRRHIDESSTITVLSSREGKQHRSSYKLLNFGKFVWGNSGKLMMLVLTAQLADVQALHNTTHKYLVSAGNATDSFSMIPILASFNMMPKNTLDLSEIHQYVDISEGLLQKILHQSDIIINDLQELANFLSTNKDTNMHPEGRSNTSTSSRAVRSLPVEESFMCEIEQDTLINLRNELQVTLEQPHEGGSNNCQLNFDSDRCEELIKLVQCGYSHLRNGFLLAVRKNMSEVVLMSKTIAEFKEKYMRLLDSIKRSHSQEYNMMKTKLETELQEQKNLLNAWISLLKEQKIKSCISEISSGKIESAVQDFKSLNDLSVLSKIIRSVYSEYGNLSEIDNIVNFIRKLPGCAPDRVAYPVLFDEMHKKNHLSSPNVLIVDSAARICMGETFMKPYVRDFIDAWAHKVSINNDKAHIIDFARKHWYAFRAILPNLIDKAYRNVLNNVENVIMFVHELPYIQDDAIGYSSLFNKMRSNGHVNSYQTLILAYKVKECMHMNNYPRIEQHYRDMFTTLRSNLPNSVIGLIWSSRNSCTIINVHYGEYLSIYKEVGVFFGPFHPISYQVFNVQTFNLVPTDENKYFYWELHMLEEGKYFKIKNKHIKMFLHSSETKYNSEGHYIGGGNCGDCVESKWRLKPEGDNFLIWSPSHEGYLYADYAKENDGGRFVFGWSQRSIPDSTKMEIMRWRIVC